MKYDVVVIGAGASGMMAAIQAAKKCSSEDRNRGHACYGSCKRVALLEVLSRPGKKILITGNGKCNLTNYRLDESCYHTDSGSTEDIISVIDRFDSKAVTDFFREEGMLARDRDGYVYPYSEQASSVLDCLRQCLAKYGIDLICGCETASVKKKDNEFIISGTIRDTQAENSRADAKKSKGGNKNSSGSDKEKNNNKKTNSAADIEGLFPEGKLSCICEKVIVATGSAAGGVCNQGISGGKNAGADEYNCELGYNIARSFGHHIVKPLPALVALGCEERFFKEISGVRAKGSVKLFIDNKYAASDQGEIQLTDNGISGIPVFQVSRYAVAALEAGRKVTAELDFMPEYSEAELTSYIDKIKSDMQKSMRKREAVQQHDLSMPGDFLTGLVNKKLMNLIIKQSSGKTSELVKMLKHFTVKIVQSKGVAFAQVCSGGVRLDEVNIDTMESKLCEGLYFCGEVLDVDGCCGGYNLQWAWSSGFTAGLNA